MSAFVPRPDEGALHIVAILPTMNPYGGVISMVNLCNQFLARRHRVTIGCLSQHGSDLVHPRTEPLYTRHRERLADLLPETGDVIVATSWETVPPALQLATRSRAAVVSYFVQDIETELDSGLNRQRVLDTYKQIDHRIVKTRHLQAELESLGYASRRVPPGMDLDIFYPRDVDRPGTRRVLAMARPDAPNDHRGWRVLAEVYNRLASDSDMELHLFGSDDLPTIEAPVVNHGRVDPTKLPALYSSADVFIDTSLVHGFGRAAVEAMACRTATVLSRSGGPDEYAVDGQNTLMVDVGDVEGTVSAVMRLLDDPVLRDRIADAALETVQGYTDVEAADAMLRLWREARGSH